MKRVAISQSNYIPWKGYFDLIANVEEFVLYDDMQYTRRDWRNRNRIKTCNGLQWLTIPVAVKGKFHQKICDTLIVDSQWSISHWSKLNQNYKSAPFFNEIREWLQPLYLDNQYSHLSYCNRVFIENICNYLNINTKIRSSVEFDLIDGKSERLANLCVQLKATDYISGPAARNYIDEKAFVDNNIRLHWADYLNYPEYSQLHGEFEHSVTILDLLFNHGPRSIEYLMYCR